MNETTSNNLSKHSSDRNISLRKLVFVSPTLLYRVYNKLTNSQNKLFGILIEIPYVIFHFGNRLRKPIIFVSLRIRLQFTHKINIYYIRILCLTRNFQIKYCSAKKSNQLKFLSNSELHFTFPFTIITTHFKIRLGICSPIFSLHDVVQFTETCYFAALYLNIISECTT